MSEKPDWDVLRSSFLDYRSSGSPSSTSKVYEALNRILQAYLNRRLRQNEIAEEIVQQCLLKIHIHRADYDSNREIKTWIFTIASRTLIDHFRRSGRERTVFSRQSFDSDSRESHAIESVPSFAKSSDDALFEKEIWSQAMKQLSKSQQEILALYFEKELDIKELSEKLEIKESAAKVRLHRVYSHLRKVFAGSPLIILNFYRLDEAIMRLLF